MTDFLKFIDDLRHRFPVHVEITYNKTCDWCIYVYKRGCAEDYPGSLSDEYGNAILCYEQNCIMEHDCYKPKEDIPCRANRK